MRKQLLFIIFVLIMIGIAPFYSYAQFPQINTDVQSKLLLIEDLLENNRFIAAQDLIDDCNSTNITDLQRTELEFLSAISSIKMGLKQAPKFTEKFEKEHTEYSRVESLKMATGDYYFKRKRYKNAVNEYAQVRSKNLSADERNEFFFKAGYSYFMNNNPKKAKKYFYKVKDSKTSYAASATYYYSHINYEDKKFDAALKGFQSLTDDPVFKTIVPCYISQIYYQKGDYDKLLQIAPKIFENAKGLRKNKISKLIGDSYFKLGNYEQASEYLQYYKESSNYGYTKNDYYQLAYSYMVMENYLLAIKYFEKVGNKKNALSQNTLYNLGNCYLSSGQKVFAAKAFYEAYQLDFDKELQENALFNYAKISYELSSDPYNRAITAINDYITAYPNSARSSEAYSYQVNLLLSSKNYKGALEAIEKIENRNTELNRVYQQIAFNRASELYEDFRFTESIEVFKKSLKYPFDKALELKAKYWLADCDFQLKNYWDAIKLWKEVASNYRINQLSEKNRINYNLGYTYYMLEDYSNAIKWFNTAINDPQTHQRLIADSYLRTGDCYYLLKDFPLAIKNYSASYQIKSTTADYALYQKALAYGGAGNLQEKVIILEDFIKEFPHSKLADDALSELGTTYLILEQNQNAVHSFVALVENYPNSPFKRHALLKIGLTYYNMDQNDQALSTLKLLVDNYSGTKESKEALVIIKNIYVESNKADDFFSYVQNIPFAIISTNAQDSISYMATENVYMDGGYNEALEGFNKYLSQYPQGAFSINAHFYRAECLVDIDDYDGALSDYEFVLQNSHDAFREPALLKTAKLYRLQNDYPSALSSYQELFDRASNEMYLSESLEGKLECYQQLKMNDSVLVMAKTILSSQMVSDETMKKAHIYRANAALQSGDLHLAQEEYTIVSKLTQGSTAAEAKYNQALIYYKLGKYKEAEGAVFELINEFGSYDYWVTKGFILMADVYVKYGNTFQAKHTLQSIIENQEDSTLVQIAKRKQLIVEELEAIEDKKYQGPEEIDSVIIETERK